VGEVHTISGPFRGVEERSAFQTEQHLEIAINVNLSRGYIEPRRGRSSLRIHSLTPGAVAQTSSLKLRLDHGQMHMINRPGAGAPMLLIVGPATVPSAGLAPAISAFWYNFDTGVLDATIIDTPHDPNFSCSFVDVLLPGRRFATLITTVNQTFVFHPYSRVQSQQQHLDHLGVFVVSEQELDFVRRAILFPEPGMIRPVSEAEPDKAYDGQFGYDDIYFYGITPPPARVAVVHQTKVFYAGFDGKHNMVLSGELPEKQDNIPESLLDGQDQMLLGKHLFMWSDDNDPLAVNEGSIGTLHTRDEVTALHSFKDNLYIFSREEMHAMVGGINPSNTRKWKIDDVGCTAPHTLITAANKMFWLNHNGIWVSDGQQTKRISDPIGSLFTEATGESDLPDMMTKPLYSTVHGQSLKGPASHWGYPWRINKSLLAKATAVHNPAEHQVWFNVPVHAVGGAAQRQNGLTIVFDYEIQAFTFYIDDIMANASFCEDGAHWGSPRGDRVFILSSETDSGTNLCELQELTQPGRDVGSDLTQQEQRSTSYFWMSAKIAKDNQQMLDFRRPRLSMLSWGKRQPTLLNKLGGGTASFELGPWWFVECEKAPFDSHFSIDSSPVYRDASQRYSSKQLVSCHPKGGEEYVKPPSGSAFELSGPPDVIDDSVPEPINSFFWGGDSPVVVGGKWAAFEILERNADTETMQWSGRSWFEQQFYPDAGEINGRWCRTGMMQAPVYDSSSDPIGTRGSFPPPICVVRSFSFEIEDMDTTR